MRAGDPGDCASMARLSDFGCQLGPGNARREIALARRGWNESNSLAFGCAKEGSWDSDFVRPF